VENTKYIILESRRLQSPRHLWAFHCYATVLISGEAQFWEEGSKIWWNEVRRTVTQLSIDKLTHIAEMADLTRQGSIAIS